MNTVLSNYFILLIFLISVEKFKSHLDTTVSNNVLGTLQEPRVGLDDLQLSLPTLPVL